jgi:quercetin dioxygenase-like cupin family protein
VNRITEVVVDSHPETEGVWIPLYPGSWFRPLLFDTVSGAVANLLKVSPGESLKRHYHTQMVQGLTLQGSWRYLEHKWVATTGTYIFEPPGEAHTLVVPEGDKPMIGFFYNVGALIYVDEQGGFVGYDDVFTLLEHCRRYYRENHLDESLLESMVR